MDASPYSNLADAIEKDKVEQVGHNFRFTVTRLSEMQKAELDQNLFDQLL